MRKILFIAVFLACIAPLYVHAQEVPKTQSQMHLSFAPLVKKTSPAVVNIYATRIVKERMLAISPFMNDPFFSRFFGMQNFGGGGVRERVANSLGSGVVVDAGGIVATNTHVVKDATEIIAVTNDGREFKATKILVDEKTDLAFLKLETKDEVLPHLDMADSDMLEVGDIVLAIGNPFGVGQTVTSGIVSGLARTGVGATDYSFFIQTDAAINPGNSGGALVDMEGRLIGINSMIYSKDGGSSGIGFAIPANMVKTILHAAKNGGKLVRPWTGFSGQSVTSDMVESLGLKRASGVLVNDVRKGGPAEKAGLKAGDIIMTIDGKVAQDPEALKYRLAMFPMASPVHLNVIRNGVKHDFVIITQAPPEMPPREETKISGLNPLSGAVVANISPALSEEIGGTEIDKGVIILKADDGNALRLGLGKGDIILSVNAQDIDSVKTLVKLLKSEKTRQWRVQIRRQGQVLNLMITL